MVRPDLIIFDCDGVLVDSEVLSCRCLSQVLAKYGIDLGVGQALDLFLGRSLTAVLEHYAALGRSIPAQFPAELSTEVRKRLCFGALPDRRGERCAGRLADPALRRVVERCRSGILLAFFDRSRAAFRQPALHVANGGAWQARA